MTFEKFNNCGMRIVLVTPSAGDDEVKGDHHLLSRRSTAIIDKT